MCVVQHRGSVFERLCETPPAGIALCLDRGQNDRARTTRDAWGDEELASIREKAGVIARVVAEVDRTTTYANVHERVFTAWAVVLDPAMTPSKVCLSIKRPTNTSAHYLTGVECISAVVAAAGKENVEGHVRLFVTKVRDHEVVLFFPDEIADPLLLWFLRVTHDVNEPACSMARCIRVKDQYGYGRSRPNIGKELYAQLFPTVPYIEVCPDHEARQPKQPRRQETARTKKRTRFATTSTLADIMGNFEPTNDDDQCKKNVIVSFLKCLPTDNTDINQQLSHLCSQSPAILFRMLQSTQFLVSLAESCDGAEARLKRLIASMNDMQ